MVSGSRLALLPALAPRQSRSHQALAAGPRLRPARPRAARAKPSQPTASAPGVLWHHSAESLTRARRPPSGSNRSAAHPPRRRTAAPPSLAFRHLLRSRYNANRARSLGVREIRALFTEGSAAGHGQSSLRLTARAMIGRVGRQPGKVRDAAGKEQEQGPGGAGRPVRHTRRPAPGATRDSAGEGISGAARDQAPARASDTPRDLVPVQDVPPGLARRPGSGIPAGLARRPGSEAPIGVAGRAGAWTFPSALPRRAGLVRRVILPGRLPTGR